MKRPKGMPARHDELCAATGKHDALCPDEGKVEALELRAEAGKWAPGKSGNVYGLRSLKHARKYMREELDGGRALLERMFFLAGLRPNDGGEFAAPFPTQARVLIKLADIFFGKEIKATVEHTGTVNHDHDGTIRVAAPALPPDWASRLTDAELAVLEDVRRKMLTAPDAAPVEDAIIVEDDKDEEKKK